ncbi:MAG: asparagine synthase (glutamine-hydrolyzing) [Nanoarchaeota archaeon]|nr:asparagine synthase (glutamine-hydrolyzing) [Nanoarchaeota archaeon]
MCGIVGFNWGDKKLVKEMNKSLVHRGPDQEGAYVDSQVSLGQRRLSIIDLSERGRQPMKNENESVLVIFNGEIYNFKELREKLKKAGHKFKSDSDTEVLVHGWEAWGLRLPSLLNGAFAFAIYDSKKKQLFLARDRMGIKPLYYYSKDGKLIFSSEIKAILKHPIKRDIDPAALKDFIALRYLPREKTMIKNIHKLLPGNYLLFDLKTKKSKIDYYWYLPLGRTNLSENALVKQIRSLFIDSVEKRLMSDVPLGVYLSGGIDSSAIVSAMSKIKERAGLDEIRTFSVGFGYGDKIDEVKYARLVAEHFNTNHKEIIIKPEFIKALPKIIWHCDEPLADPAMIPVYLMSQEAKKHMTVVLSGDGADEVLAGYEQIKFMKLLNKVSKIPKPIRAGATIATKFIPKPVMNKFFKYSEALGEEGLKRLSKAVLADNNFERYFEMISIFDEEEQKKIFNEDLTSNYKKEFSTIVKNNNLNRLLLFEARTLLPDNMLTKADRMTMAHSIEARVPFLDHRLVELLFRIPASLKIKGGSEKYLLKRAMHGHLPKKIIERKKQRFYVPIDLWIQKDIRSVIQSTLDKDLLTQYFNRRYVEKVFRNYDRSRLFYARQLWNLFTFHLWHQIHIEDKMPKL